MDHGGLLFSTSEKKLVEIVPWPPGGPFGRALFALGGELFLLLLLLLVYRELHLFVLFRTILTLRHLDAPFPSAMVAGPQLVVESLRLLWQIGSRCPSWSRPTHPFGSPRSSRSAPRCSSTPESPSRFVSARSTRKKPSPCATSRASTFGPACSRPRPTARSSPSTSEWRARRNPTHASRWSVRSSRVSAC